MKTKSLFALVDCNNFYVSCEKVFAPHLEGKAVVILSNNDGCIVSRSDEAKSLGIPMGAPYFAYKKLLQDHQGVALSSNYQLYGDMSSRIMQSLAILSQEMEVYSIDEAFLKISNLDFTQAINYAVDIRYKIFQWTGIPVSIGIGPTKSLAKIANSIAKKNNPRGVYMLGGDNNDDSILACKQVEEIWGISRKWGEKLRYLGINTALDLKCADSRLIKKSLTIVGERIQCELNGISCLDINLIQPKRNILSSRSFGKLLTELEPIEEAISSYAARACEKLRLQQSRAQSIYVYLRTNRFRKNDIQSSEGMVYVLPYPQSDTSMIIKAAINCIRTLYQNGYKYKKAGIILLDLVPINYVQQNLFYQTDYLQSDKLMGVLDKLNRKYGNYTLFYAAQGMQREWQMRCDHRSKRYTTHWKELLEVR